MKLKQHIPLVFLMTLTLAACVNEDKVPKKYLQPMQMEAVLMDMKAANAYGENIKLDSTQTRDSVNKAFYKKILEIHHLTPNQFMTSYQYYEAHPKVLEMVYDSMLVDVRRRSKALDSLDRPKLKKLPPR